MARKRNRSNARATSKLNWKQIVHHPTSSSDPSEPVLPPPLREEDWLQAAVPQSLVSDAQAAVISTPQRRDRRRRKGSLNLSLVWLTAFGISGGLAILAAFWLTKLPPAPDCNNITPLTADVERLYCAQVAAQSGAVPQVLAGIALVRQWPSDHPLYGEAQHLLDEWTMTLLALARNSFRQGDLKRATEIVSQIPPNSPRYDEVKAALAGWQQQWQQGQKIYDTAQTALKQQKWNEASAQVTALLQVESEYWQRQRADELTQQILTEKQAWEQLVAARDRAKSSTPQALGSALAEVIQVNDKTYAWAAAKADRDRWLQAIVDAGLQRWRSGDRAGALAAVEAIPASLNRTPLIQDLMHYGEAHQLATKADSRWQPSLQQVLNLREALAAVQKIQTTSPFHAEAQSDLKTWQQQLQDLTQLQVAQLTASLGQKQSLELAIEQAQEIAAGRPRRLQAQTLIAHWRQEIQRIEDRPYIERAEQLAQPGNIPALKAAIAQASVIPLGRALRPQAQGLIAQWISNIEIIEDQPILDEARSLAQAGRLSRAITVAQKIGSDRALYGEARAEIREWRAEIRRIQIAQDRPILNEAYSLAEVESYTLAIEKASQIAPGRALYGEAQGAIAGWQVKRQEIWDAWAAEEETDSYSEDDYYEDDYYEDEYDEGSY